MPTANPITTKKEGRIATITLNRPERRNALDLAMWQGLRQAVDALEQDKEVRVILIRGAGDKAFASGADIREFNTIRASPGEGAAYDAIVDAGCAAIAGARIPVIAMIHGYCMGGGLMIAVACDLRFAADDARFSIPAARLGLAYPMTGVRDVMSLIGPSATKDLLMSARVIDSAEASSMGLVDRRLAKSELETETRAFAARIAGNAPITIAAAKAAVRALRTGNGYDAALARALGVRAYGSNDFEEGRTAFLEHRSPVFTGK